MRLNPLQAHEHWYLSDKEWEQYRSDLRRLSVYSRRMRQIRVDQEQSLLNGQPTKLIRIVTEQMEKMEREVNRKRKLLPTAMKDAQEEFLAFVADWRKDRDQLRAGFAEIKRLLKTDRWVVKQSHTLKRIDKATAEMVAARPLLRRLKQREQLLYEAVQAGLFLTRDDVAELHERGLLDEKTLELLQYQLGSHVAD